MDLDATVWLCGDEEVDRPELLAVIVSGHQCDPETLVQQVDRCRWQLLGLHGQCSPVVADGNADRNARSG
ncbi:hypothetical protein HEB94_000816 [Actinopolymorpha pittospori]|uniref:Uncharacterized protein n=1 Tax=Actinopolymorpha pittospori TaxID=648752 RepID=A0A927MRN1_9ACTN|nr:hypothetical protein [Actinopolymorpha pittospori]